MSRQEIKYRAKQRRSREVARKRVIVLLATVLLITVGSILFGNCFSVAQGSAKASEQNYKYYKSIVIEKGDTLWNIAKEYRTDAYDSTQEYMEELIRVNNLSSDQIHEGQHLLIAYFDTEFK